jgi:hypothetical protein
MMLLVSGVSAALAVFMIFGKRQRFIYWIVASALLLVLYRQVMGVLYFPPKNFGEVIMKCSITLLLLWLVIRFIFGVPSRLYHRISGPPIKRQYGRAARIPRRG